MSADPSNDPNPPAAAESLKRQQILDGARRCFLASGFEAASMGQIAQEARVSKGTLYVYFDSKESLFSALVEESKRGTAEQFMRLDGDQDEDISETLARCMSGLIVKLSSPDHIALVRMVIGASEKFPQIARSFFAAGSEHGALHLTAYLREQIKRGRLRMEDPETAAWQLMGMCNHPVLTRILLGGAAAPDAERARAIAETHVATFLAAYAVR